MALDEEFPQVYEPWWDVWRKDDYTYDLEWTPHSYISEEEEYNE